MSYPEGLFLKKESYPSHCYQSCGQCLSCFAQDIDSQKWDKSIQRRTQHYGARYDYKHRKLFYDVQPMDSCKTIQKLSSDLEPYFRHYGNNGYPLADQCIVNDYLCNQYISAHTDNKCFGPVVASLSLGYSMILVMKRKGFDNFSMMLEHGDLLIMTGSSRYDWTHELLPSMDPSFRRVSITFRSIV